MEIRAPRRFVYLTLLGAIGVIFFLLRARWMNHLLMYDEAMNLCSTRAFAAGGSDPYSAWFWRYPPLFNSLLLLARPLVAGFVQRAEWIPLCLGLLQLAVLAALNKRVFGFWPALWSCLAFSLMPSAVFFGVWIKQDNLLIVAGLLALLLCAQERWALCGLALGFAFLSKEMAVFYAIAIAIVMIQQRKFRELVIVGVITFLTSCWWYFGFSISIKQFLNFAVSVPVESGNIWVKPLDYYFQRMPLDLGPAGVAIAAVGFVLLLRRRGISLWPLALFVPTLVILTISKGKTPWYMMSAFPALATMQAIALCDLWTMLRQRFPKRLTGALVPAVASLAAALFLVFPVYNMSYAEHMFAREPGMWLASDSSHQAATTLNHLVDDGESALITPMHYYDEFLKLPCPIFVIYLKDMPVLVRPNTLTEAEFVDAVKKYNLDWAMVSPPRGQGENELLEPIVRDYNLLPLILHDAVIFKTTALRPSNPVTENDIAPAVIGGQNPQP